MSDGETTASPPPPQRGWYPVPGEPNYQHFWDGQKWVSQRYWGGAGATDPSPLAGTSPSGWAGPDPPAGHQRPSFDAPVQRSGFFGPPLNPRSPARQIAVAVLSFVLLFVYLSLHIFPARVVIVLFALSLVLLLVELPSRLRFLRDPARRAAIREPITFQSNVWLQFRYAPSRVPYFQIGRRCLAVRTDSFQLTSWVFGSRDRARSTFFNAAEAVMWQEVVDGRPCIGVSGPTYNRSKVEFVFSAQADNAAAWNALAAAGVRMAPAPDATSGGGTKTAPTDEGHAAPAARRFTRLGSDLGTTRSTRFDSPPTGRSPGTADSEGRSTPAVGGRRRKAPIPAGRWTPAFIVGAVVFVVVAPLLLATIARVTFGQNGMHVATTPLLLTTQCVHEPGATPVVWNGSVTKTSPLAAQGHVDVVVEAVTPEHAELGVTRQELPIPADAADVVPLGPVDVTVPPGTTGQVTCQASFAHPSGIG